MKTILHVNQHHIKFNAKNEVKKPVFTIKQGKKTYYAEEVEIHGPSKLIYSPEKPLSCGAKVWVVTESEVTMHNKTTFKELNDG
ncbi:hypothetical protein C4588_03565 [Candidatus Parcubacteria bacterium]|nr:MAG: hypothetical protein C4588_03565 [Candidatus Parcubacteria bacterium]